jgi:hypothetical protein
MTHLILQALTLAVGGTDLFSGLAGDNINPVRHEED